MNKIFFIASLMLMSVSSAMAQKEMFGNRQELTYEDDFIMFFSPPSRFFYGDNGGKMMNFILDVDENLVGYQVYNENLELEKELRTFMPSKGVIIHERKNSGDTQWTETSRDTVDFDWTLVGYDDTSTNLWGVNAGQEDDVWSMSLVNVTQTLFNNDKSYELIQPIHGESRVVTYNYDFTVRTIRINTSITEYAITSENGEILYSIKPRSGYVFGNAVSVIGVGDKNYLTVNMRDMAGVEELVCFYEIDKNTNSVKFVREISDDYGWWCLIDQKFMFDKESRLIYGGVDDEILFREWTVLDKKLKEEKVFNIPNGEGVRTREKRNTDNGFWEETYRTIEYGHSYLMSTSKLVTTSFYSDDAMGLCATFTQTLFNNDDKYEIFTPVWGGKVVKYDDDYLSRETYTNYFVTAYNVVSEDGSVLCTLETGGDCYFGEVGYVYDIYDKRYLMIPVFDASDVDSPYYSNDPSEATFRYYEINRETNSIDFICEVKDEMKVSPTVADKDDVITVTLNTPKENAQMIVTSVSGQMVKRYTLSDDDKYITLDAATLRSGVYCISLHKNGAVIDSEKIIIK